jgi:hypothetical protein
VKRAYKFLLRPTDQQTGRLVACLEDHRQLYNAALEHRRSAYRMAGVTVRYGDQSAELKDIRRADLGGAGPLVVLQPTGHPAPPGSGDGGVPPPRQGWAGARLPEVQG